MSAENGQRGWGEGVKGTYGGEAEYSLSFDLFGEASDLEVLGTEGGTPLGDAVALAVEEERSGPCSAVRRQERTRQPAARPLAPSSER